MSRKLRPLAALAMVVLIGAGCSNGSAENGDTGSGSTRTGSTSTGSTSTGSTGSSKTATNREKAMKFAECMRDNGVTEFPDPNASGELTIDGIANGSSLDPSTPTWKQAIGACKDLQPPGFTGHTRSAQEQEHALEFAQCMRDSGVKDFPDPTRDGPLIDTSRIPSAAGRGARSIPGFQAAMQRCTAIYSGELGLKGQ
jgi:hypothetical protein